MKRTESYPCRIGSSTHKKREVVPTLPCKMTWGDKPYGGPNERPSLGFVWLRMSSCGSEVWSGERSKGGEVSVEEIFWQTEVSQVCRLWEKER